MPTTTLIDYDDASPRVKAVYDDIRATRGTDFINNFWKALANQPDNLERGLGRIARGHGAGHARSDGERDDLHRRLDRQQLQLLCSLPHRIRPRQGA